MREVLLNMLICPIACLIQHVVVVVVVVVVVSC